MNFSFRQIFLSEFSFWALIGVLAIYYVYPPRDTLKFGSDLVGGTYLTLVVQTEKAVEAELISKLPTIEARLQQEGKIAPIAKNIAMGRITLQFDTVQNAQEAARVVKDLLPELHQTVSGMEIQLAFPDKVSQRIKSDAVSRNIEVLRRRLDKFSVAEIPIAAQGEKNIIVELPDVADPQKAKEMIGRAAQLDFRLVEEVGRTKEDILYKFDGDLPSDKEILPGKRDGSVREYYLVTRFAQITGRMLKDARPAFGGRSGIEPIVEFAFTSEGGDLFYELTSKNYGRRLAIVLDGEVISTPGIEVSIRDKGIIQGSFTTESAKTLASLLKSGSFVAPVTFEEERQIGPALGQESRYKGVISCLIGLGLLLLFSIFFYKLSGFFAFFALIYNLIMVVAGLAWLKATLTLPGIAGMVLTIGMAIDASILIFERIKELLAEGITTKKAVKEGFSGAIKVILDANITTFIVGSVLYYFGTGPIQGFAVTMMLGIIATLITGLFFLRSLFMFVLNVFDVQKLSI